MKYKIWNKSDSINGVESSYILKKYNINSNDSIFLVIDNYNNVVEFQFVNTIKSIYNLSNTLTDEQVAQEYLRIKEEEKLQQEKEQITLEQQAVKISILSEKIDAQTVENSKVEEYQIRQDTEILDGLLASTELFEMVLSIMPVAINIDENKNLKGADSKMVTVYVTLILKGAKTIEDVPAIIRPQVQEQLDLLLK